MVEKADYAVARSSGQCSVSGRPFEAGESFYTVLFETPEGFERRDISESAWQGPPEGAFCSFKTRLPEKEQPRRSFVADEVLLGFFLRLADCDGLLKQQFRFVLSLILMRKRLLKYEKTLRENGREYWEMRLVREKTRHRVFNPELSDEEIQRLTHELGAILLGDESDPDSGTERSDGEDTSPRQTGPLT